MDDYDCTSKKVGLFSYIFSLLFGIFRNCSHIQRLRADLGAQMVSVCFGGSNQWVCLKKHQQNPHLKLIPAWLLLVNNGDNDEMCFGYSTPLYAHTALYFSNLGFPHKAMTVGGLFQGPAWHREYPHRNLPETWWHRTLTHRKSTGVIDVPGCYNHPRTR